MVVKTFVKIEPNVEYRKKKGYYLFAVIFCTDIASS